MRIGKSRFHVKTTQFGQVPIVKTDPLRLGVAGIATGCEPFQISATSSRMNDIPIAVISGTSRGALRSGLYATRSIEALRRAQPAIAITSATRIAGISVPRPDVSVRLNIVERDRRRDHPADHEHVAVGEVDQLEDAVDERVAERDECVERAVREPDQEDSEEEVPVVDEVLDQPADDDCDERKPDCGHDERRGRPAALRRDSFSL